MRSKLILNVRELFKVEQVLSGSEDLMLARFKCTGYLIQDSTASETTTFIKQFECGLKMTAGSQSSDPFELFDFPLKGNMPSDTLRNFFEEVYRSQVGPNGRGIRIVGVTNVTMSNNTIGLDIWSVFSLDESAGGW